MTPNTIIVSINIPSFNLSGYCLLKRHALKHLKFIFPRCFLRFFILVMRKEHARVTECWPRDTQMEKTPQLSLVGGRGKWGRATESYFAYLKNGASVFVMLKAVPAQSLGAGCDSNL